MPNLTFAFKQMLEENHHFKDIENKLMPQLAEFLAGEEITPENKFTLCKDFFAILAMRASYLIEKLSEDKTEAVLSEFSQFYSFFRTLLGKIRTHFDNQNYIVDNYIVDNYIVDNYIVDLLCSELFSNLAALMKQLAKTMHKNNYSLERFENEFFPFFNYFIAQEAAPNNANTKQAINKAHLLEECLSEIPEQYYEDAAKNKKNGLGYSNILKTLEHNSERKQIVLHYYYYLKHLNKGNSYEKCRDYAQFCKKYNFSKFEVLSVAIKNYTALIVAFKQSKYCKKDNVKILDDKKYNLTFSQDLKHFLDIATKLPEEHLNGILTAPKPAVIDDLLNQFSLNFLLNINYDSKNRTTNESRVNLYLSDHIKNRIMSLKGASDQNFSRNLSYLLEYRGGATLVIINCLELCLAKKTTPDDKLNSLASGLQTLKAIKNEAFYEVFVECSAQLFHDIYFNMPGVNANSVQGVTKYQSSIVELSDDIRNSELYITARTILPKKLSYNNTRAAALAFLDFMVFIQNPFHRQKDVNQELKCFLTAMNYSNDEELMINAMVLVGAYLAKLEPQTPVPLQACGMRNCDREAKAFYKNTCVDIINYDRLHQRIKYYLQKKPHLGSDEINALESYALRSTKELIFSIFLRVRNGEKKYSMNDLFTGIFIKDYDDEKISERQSIIEHLNISNSELVLIASIRQAKSFDNLTKATESFCSLLRKSTKAQLLGKSYRKREIEKFEPLIKELNAAITEIKTRNLKEEKADLSLPLEPPHETSGSEKPLANIQPVKKTTKPFELTTIKREKALALEFKIPNCVPEMIAKIDAIHHNIHLIKPVIFLTDDRKKIRQELSNIQTMFYDTKQLLKDSFHPIDILCHMLTAYAIAEYINSLEGWSGFHDYLRFCVLDMRDIIAHNLSTYKQWDIFNLTIKRIKEDDSYKKYQKKEMILKLYKFMKDYYISNWPQEKTSLVNISSVNAVEEKLAIKVKENYFEHDKYHVIANGDKVNIFEKDTYKEFHETISEIITIVCEDIALDVAYTEALDEYNAEKIKLNFDEIKKEYVTQSSLSQYAMKEVKSHTEFSQELFDNNYEKCDITIYKEVPCEDTRRKARKQAEVLKEKLSELEKQLQPFENKMLIAKQKFEQAFKAKSTHYDIYKAALSSNEEIKIKAVTKCMQKPAYEELLNKLYAEAEATPALLAKAKQLEDLNKKWSAFKIDRPFVEGPLSLAEAVHEVAEAQSIYPKFSFFSESKQELSISLEVKPNPSAIEEKQEPLDEPVQDNKLRQELYSAWDGLIMAAKRLAELENKSEADILDEYFPQDPDKVNPLLMPYMDTLYFTIPDKIECPLALDPVRGDDGNVYDAKTLSQYMNDLRSLGVNLTYPTGKPYIEGEKLTSLYTLLSGGLIYQIRDTIQKIVDKIVNLIEKASKEAVVILEQTKETETQNNVAVKFFDKPASAESQSLIEKAAKLEVYDAVLPEQANNEEEEKPVVKPRGRRGEFAS